MYSVHGVRVCTICSTALYSRGRPSIGMARRDGHMDEMSTAEDMQGLMDEMSTAEDMQGRQHDM